MSRIDVIIKEQEIFAENVNLTLQFLKIYKGNPEDMQLLIGSQLASKYDINFEEPDHFVEALDEMFNDFVHGDIKLCIVHTGIYPVLTLKEKKRACATIDDIKRIFKPYSEGSWEI